VNDGSAVDPISGLPGAAITAPEPPTKEGHVFAGWFSDFNLTIPYQFTQIPSSNITIYAKWTLETYRLSFELEDGTVISSSMVDLGSLIIFPDNPVSDNFVFAGWVPNIDVPFTLTHMLATDLTFVADWATEGLYFELTNNQTYQVSKGTASSSIIRIPNYYQGVLVTKIADKGFSKNMSVTEYILPRSLITIGNGAFEMNTALTTFVIPANVTSIGDYAFTYCISLTSIHIPANVLSIGRDAFNYCFTLEELTFDEGVTSIGNQAFANNSSLVSVTLPSSLTRVSVMMFAYATGLETIIIKDGTITIDRQAFFGCKNLVSIQLPNNLQYIEEAAFFENISLNNVVLPSSLIKIGNAAFAGATSLSTITIPQSVQIIGMNAFYGCTALVSITVDPNNAIFASHEGVLYNKTFNELWVYPSAKEGTTLSILNTVTVIKDAAITFNQYLTMIEIPSSVFAIAAFGLAYNPYVNVVILPINVTDMGMFVVGSTANVTVFIEATEKPTNWADQWFGDHVNAIFGTVPTLKTYTFESNGGSVVASLSYYLVPEKPFVEKEGWYLIGWFDNPSLTGESLNFPYYTENNATLYAAWSDTPVYDGKEFSTAYPLELNEKVTANVTSTVQKVYFKFVVPEDGHYLYYTMGGKDLFMLLYNSDLENIGMASGSTNIVNDMMWAEGDIYYFAISITNADYLGDFKFTVEPVGTQFDFNYYLNESGTYTISNYFGNDTDLVLPTTYLGIPVTEIGHAAFYGEHGLITITIPEGYKIIHYHAFVYCMNLEKIFIADSITDVGPLAFDDTFGALLFFLGTEMPENLDPEWNIDGNLYFVNYTLQIETYVFNSMGGTPIDSIVDYYVTDEPIPSNGALYFAGWYNNSDYTGYRVIFPYYSNDPLKLTLYAKWSNEPIDNMGDYEFVAKNDGTYKITQYFGSDTSIVLPNSYMGYPVNEIANNAFNFKNNLVSVVIPEGFTSIGNMAFYYCTSITSITLPDSMLRIGNSAFAYMFSLTDFHIGANLYHIGNEIFDKNALFSHLTVSSNNKYFQAFEGVLFNKDLTELVYYPAGLINTSYVIPNSVKVIGIGAFRFNDILVSITFPDHIDLIGMGAFLGASKLVNIVIPSVDEIGSSAFRDCSALESVIIGSNLKQILYATFYNASKLSHVELPDDLLTISEEAFGNTALTSFTFGRYINYIDSKAFRKSILIEAYHVDPLNVTYYSVEGVLYIHSVKIVFLYPAGNPQKTYTIIDGIEYTGITTFQDSQFLETVFFPSSLTRINNGAFARSKSLLYLILPSTIQSIGEEAFAYCDNLRGIWIPQSVTTVQNYAFYETPNLILFIESNAIPSSWSNDWNVSDNDYYIGVIPTIKTYQFETNLGSTVSSIEYFLVLEAPLTTLEGMYFAGWYNNALFEGEPVRFPYYSFDAAPVLYAKWSETPITPGSTFELAIEIGIWAPIEISLEEDQSLYFKFTVNYPSEFIIYSSGIHAIGMLYDSEFNLLASDDNSNNEGNFQIRYLIVTEGTYYIKVSLDEFYTDSSGTLAIGDLH
jgi:uncharacterized repeat protein (TIGR02543 family)